MKSGMPLNKIRVFNPHRRAIKGSKGGEQDGVEEQNIGGANLARFLGSEVLPSPRVPGRAEGDWSLPTVPATELYAFTISDACNGPCFARRGCPNGRDPACSELGLPELGAPSPNVVLGAIDDVHKS